MNNDIIKPKVSWLICSNVINAHLYEALDSCINQTFSNFEIIFITNGPDANYVADAVSTKYKHEPRIRVYPSNIKFLTHSLNLALDLARGELIARIDADDFSSPDRLSIQVNFMDNNKDVDVLGSNYNIIDNNGMQVDVVNLPESHAAIKEKLYFKNVICHPSVMYRKNAIQEIGGYMGGIQAEDYDLWCRLSVDKAKNFSNSQQRLISYRSVNVSNNRKSYAVYASVAATQLRCFLLTMNYKWLLGTFLTSFKVICARCNFISAK